MANSKAPFVGIIMGSDSDLPTMQSAIAVCEDFEIPYEVAIVSAHLPGMVASLTPLPTIGVPVKTSTLSGVDSLYSIVQMPRGIPVATVAIGNATNAGLLAVQILATHQPELLERVRQYRQTLQQSVLDKQAKLDELGYRAYLAQHNQ